MDKKIKSNLINLQCFAVFLIVVSMYDNSNTHMNSTEGIKTHPALEVSYIYTKAMKDTLNTHFCFYLKLDMCKI